MGAVAGIGERVLVHLNFLPPGGRCMVQASLRASQFKVVVFLRACQSGRGEERREVCFEWGHAAGTGKRILLRPRSFQCSCRFSVICGGWGPHMLRAQASESSCIPILAGLFVLAFSPQDGMGGSEGGVF